IALHAYVSWHIIVGLFPPRVKTHTIFILRRARSRPRVAVRRTLTPFGSWVVQHGHADTSPIGGRAGNERTLRHRRGRRQEEVGCRAPERRCLGLRSGPYYR